MISKWTSGTRVRVTADDLTNGWLGTIHVPNYAEFLDATSVVLDNDPEKAPAFYADEELEDE